MSEASQALSILLVEDNLADVKIAMRAFQRAEFQNKVAVVRDGEEVLKMMNRAVPFDDYEKYPEPHVILLDINLPRLNGFQVLEHIKSPESFWCKVPVIILSSSQQEDDIRKSYDFGAEGYVPKPIHFEDFGAVVDRFYEYWRLLNRLP